MKPPLELHVEVTDADGVRYRWDSSSRWPGDRPQDMTLSTKRGEGFADASVTLARRVDRDYVDLHLFDDVAFVGVDGSVAYEGRIAAMPRTIQDAHSINVQLAGHMAHARDRPFTEIFADRDLSSWTTPSRTQQAALLAANWSMHDMDATRDASNFPAINLRIKDSWLSPYKPITLAVYDAGSLNKVNTLWYHFRAGSSLMDVNFEAHILGGTSDSSFDIDSGDLWAGVDVSAYQVLTGARRFVALELLYNTTPAGIQGATFSLFAANPTVYGDHGLSVYGPNPGGLYASDVMKYIAQRYCPLLNTDGVQQTTWPIPHLTFKELTDPYDAFTLLNAYHLWEIGVWENKTLTFGPSNRLDYDWEFRASDFGGSLEQQGDTTQDLANGMLVEFTNVSTGVQETLTPEIYSDLIDTNPDNPANRHGISRWPKITLSQPTTVDSALQIGRAALLEYNAPKGPGTINVTGHVKDRAGHWQPGWKVRAGDTIAITDHPNDVPRLITETSWNQESKQLSVTVDSTAKRLDAILDRMSVALTAAGLT